MNYVLWLIAGGLLGWLTSILMGRSARKGILLNVLIASVGAFLLGLFLTPLFDLTLATVNHFNLPAMLISLLGALVVLPIFNHFRHRKCKDRQSENARVLLNLSLLSLACGRPPTTPRKEVMFRTLFKIAVVSCIGAMSISASALDSPLALIRATVQQTLGVLQDPAIQGASYRLERFRKLEAVILPHLDTEGMAQRSLGLYWRQLTEDEKKEFLMIFTSLVEHTYGSTIDRYVNDLQVSYDQEHIDGDFAEVDTHVLTPSQDRPLSINYSLHQANGQWLISDVQIDHVSLVLNYRAQFSRILGASSYGGLVSRLQQKLQELDTPAS
jgi:phospholipid transport system substrate-binding protein